MKKHMKLATLFLTMAMVLSLSSCSGGGGGSSAGGKVEGAGLDVDLHGGLGERHALQELLGGPGLGILIHDGGACVEVTGVYLSPANLSYQNMRPQYNYYLTTFTQQEITLMDNNTYCLVLSSSTFSPLSLAA